jgi:hypothetical protein
LKTKFIHVHSLGQLNINSEIENQIFVFSKLRSFILQRI